MKTQILCTVTNSLEAHLIKNRLENEGIQCFIFNEHFSDLLPDYFQIMGSGVQVRVLEKDFQAAKDIIKPTKDKLTCPNCNSDQITAKADTLKHKIKFLFISLFITGLIGNLLQDFKCDVCNTQFKKQG